MRISVNLFKLLKMSEYTDFVDNTIFKVNLVNNAAEVE